MARRVVAKARVSSPRAARPRRATFGELIAAAYDAVGPKASVDDVARLLEAPLLRSRIRTRLRLA